MLHMLRLPIAAFAYAKRLHLGSHLALIHLLAKICEFRGRLAPAAFLRLCHIAVFPSKGRLYHELTAGEYVTNDSPPRCSVDPTAPMCFRTLYCIRKLRFVVPLCLFTGCWEEIEYQETAPAAVATQPKATPARRDQAAPAVVETEQVEASPAESPAVEQAPAETRVAEAPATEVSPPVVDDESGDVGNRYASVEVPAESSETIAPPTDNDFEPSSSSEFDTTAAPMTDESAPASATEETFQSPQSVSTRRAAWLLGSRLGLAALAHDRNIAREETIVWLDEARAMAGVLDTSITELPAPSKTNTGPPASREVLSYLLSEGKRVGGELAKNQGPDHASMFEVALKSNLLLVLNKPDTAAVGHISTAIERAAPQAGLPAELWRPLLDTLAQKSPPAAVRRAVRQMHAAVDAHLAATAEP
jgi:hypothetical protein